ncbi:MAG TPA: DUF3943 domain-containing protein [Verrucomicrobiae bacterium]|nr:DUF3943 domain-containing protein [Verrucomicrobiae bacterium]
MAFAAEPQTATDEKVAPSAFNRDEPESAPKFGWGLGEGKSYWVPVGNIVLFDFLLNQFDRNFVDPQEEYESNWDSIEENFTGSWVFDSDDFDINQFGHPYQGSIYHGFARSAGLGYWTSLGYTIGASAMWEIAGEVTPPSINDQITTGIGGTFLGEPLYRMASLILENAHGQPSGLREFAASMLAPGFNRTAFGSRFDGVFPSGDPAVHTRANLGANVNSQIRSNVNTNPDPNAPQTPQSYQSGTAVLDFTMVYGLPGKPGYAYDRPFDYFNFQLTATPDNVLENLMTRGLLAGSTIGGNSATYRGIWGLYGSYDYISPQIFRVSNTALNLGTTGQWWVSENVALQNEVIAGVGYGSGGVTKAEGLRDYHYGITPQALVGLRFIFADVAALEVSARDYYITDKGSDAEPGSENLARGDVSLTVRLHDLHGITLRYIVSDRNANYEARPDTEQRVAAISVGYTYLGHKWFGAVDWRPRPESRTGEMLEDAKDAVKEGAKDVIEETQEIVK